MTFAPPRPPVPSRVDDVPHLASFMLAQGVATLAWAVFCVAAAAVLVVLIASGGGDAETPWALVGYCFFAVGAGLAGTLQVIGSRRIREFRGRTFALVALWSGVASFPCGTICCLPTGIALVVYGMTVLLDPAVVAAFERTKEAR